MKHDIDDLIDSLEDLKHRFTKKGNIGAIVDQAIEALKAAKSLETTLEDLKDG